MVYLSLIMGSLRESTAEDLKLRWMIRSSRMSYS